MIYYLYLYLVVKEIDIFLVDYEPIFSWMVWWIVVSLAQQGSSPCARIYFLNYFRISSNTRLVGGDVPIDYEGIYGDFINCKVMRPTRSHGDAHKVGCVCMCS